MHANRYAFRLLSLLALTTMLACNKSISNVTASLPPLNPATEDLDAGAWKTILLTRPDTFAVATPAATSSVRSNTGAPAAS